MREWLRAAVRVLGLVVTSLLALLLFCTLLAGLVLVPLFGMGVPVVAGSLRATRTLADLHRREAGSVLGVRLTGSYTSEPGWAWRNLVACLRDQQNGRDAVWLLVHGVGGYVVFWVGYMLAAVLSGAVIASDGPLSFFTLPVW
jgi:hypothetical protein